jgi:hypothetical protein
MNVRFKHDMHFTAGIFWDDKMRMNNYHLALWMNTNTSNTVDQNIAFERVKYFIYTQLDSTIFINKNLEIQCKKFQNAGLNITTLPGEPVDQLVGIMLYHKLNAITENRLDVVETELGSTQGENVVYLHSDYEQTLGFEISQWWLDPGMSHCDFITENSDKILSISDNSQWRDLDLDWSNDESVVDNPGNVVVFADFKKPNETE